MTNLTHAFLMYLFYASTCFDWPARQTVTHQSVLYQMMY
jgi:hypothetical protein